MGLLITLPTTGSRLKLTPSQGTVDVSSPMVEVSLVMAEVCWEILLPGNWL